MTSTDDSTAGERRVPLSSAQRRLWFLDQLIAAPAAYNVPGMYRIRGPLDESVVRRGLAELMRRHELLRAAFGQDDGRPFQSVSGPRAVPVPLDVVDLDGRPAAERRATLRDRAGQEVAAPFDLGAAPLWRAVLVRLAPGDHILLLTVHHIVADGWSLPILLDELTRLCAGEQLPEPAGGIAEYVAWEEGQLRGDRLAALEAYWTSALDDAPPVLALPADRRRDGAPSHRGDAVEFELPPELVERVRRTGRELRASPFVVLLTAFGALLYRHSGQSSPVIGSPTAGRTLVEHEGLVGYFANTVPLRLDFAGDPTFAEAAARVRSVTLAALDHSLLPFERIVAAVDPPRDPGVHPLFQVLFSMTPLGSAWSAGPLTVEALTPLRNQTAKFDLSLQLFDEDAGVSGVFEFATDVFDPETVARLRDEYLALLQEAVDDPHARLAGPMTGRGSDVDVDAGPDVDADVDTSAADSPSRAQPAYVAPRSAAEATLAAIWQTVLAVDRVGVHDDFFALGGHSLLATRIIARTRAAFPVAVDLAMLFEAPTIAGFAAALHTATAVSRTQGAGH